MQEVIAKEHQISYKGQAKEHQSYDIIQYI
jgi:hypothetical protein